MKNNNTVSVSFMLLGILFCVCLVAANLLETKVVQIWKITATAGLVVFPISYIINAVSYTHLTLPTSDLV